MEQTQVQGQVQGQGQGQSQSQNPPVAKESSVQKPKTKKEIAMERRKESPSPVLVEDRKCFACDRVCESRNQLNHHYSGCEEFYKKFDSLKMDDRHWHMTIQYAAHMPSIAGRICIGCGLIQTSRDALHRHFLKCKKALGMDQWDRISMFGLLEGGEHDDSAAHMTRYVPRKTVPEFVSRMYKFVAAIKEDLKQKSIQKVEKDLKSCDCRNCAYVQNEPPIPHAGLSDAQKDGYLVIPVTMAGYGTIINGRAVYVPQQQVYVRIHDKGPAP